MSGGFSGGPEVDGCGRKRSIERRGNQVGRRRYESGTNEHCSDARHCSGMVSETGSEFSVARNAPGNLTDFATVVDLNCKSVPLLLLSRGRNLTMKRLLVSNEPFLLQL